MTHLGIIRIWTVVIKEINKTLKVQQETLHVELINTINSM
jgi:hypothetical protein